MKRRKFFGGLATLLAAPAVLAAAKPNKTEKHWVCLQCGEPTPPDLTTGLHPSCLNCGAHISCTAWK